MAQKCTLGFHLWRENSLFCQTLYINTNLVKTTGQFPIHLKVL
jgi:hypothetical protein